MTEQKVAQEKYREALKSLSSFSDRLISTISPPSIATSLTLSAPPLSSSSSLSLSLSPLSPPRSLISSTTTTRSSPYHSINTNRYPYHNSYNNNNNNNNSNNLNNSGIINNLIKSTPSLPSLSTLSSLSRSNDSINSNHNDKNITVGKKRNYSTINLEIPSNSNSSDHPFESDHHGINFSDPIESSIKKKITIIEDNNGNNGGLPSLINNNNNNNSNMGSKSGYSYPPLHYLSSSMMIEQNLPKIYQPHKSPSPPPSPLQHQYEPTVVTSPPLSNPTLETTTTTIHSPKDLEKIQDYIRKRRQKDEERKRKSENKSPPQPNNNNNNNNNSLSTSPILSNSSSPTFDDSGMQITNTTTTTMTTSPTTTTTITSSTTSLDQFQNDDSPPLVYEQNQKGNGSISLNSSSKKVYKKRKPSLGKSDSAIGAHVDSDLEFTNVGGYPKVFVQGGNMSEIQFMVKGSFTNRLGEEGTNRDLVVVATSKVCEDFQLSNNVENVKPTGEVIFKGISVQRLGDSKELIIIFGLYDKSRHILLPITHLESDILICYNTTKDLPPPSIERLYWDTFDTTSPLVTVHLEADRLKWGRSNLMTLYIVENENGKIHKTIQQSEFERGTQMKKSAFIKLERDYLNGSFDMYIKYTESKNNNSNSSNNNNSKNALDNSFVITPTKMELLSLPRCPIPSFEVGGINLKASQTKNPHQNTLKSSTSSTSVSASSQRTRLSVSQPSTSTFSSPPTPSSSAPMSPPLIYSPRPATTANMSTISSPSSPSVNTNPNPNNNNTPPTSSSITNITSSNPITLPPIPTIPNNTTLSKSCGNLVTFNPNVNNNQNNQNYLLYQSNNSLHHLHHHHQLNNNINQNEYSSSSSSKNNNYVYVSNRTNREVLVKPIYMDEDHHLNSTVINQIIDGTLHEGKTIRGQNETIEPRQSLELNLGNKSHAYIQVFIRLPEFIPSSSSSDDHYQYLLAKTIEKGSSFSILPKHIDNLLNNHIGSPSSLGSFNLSSNDVKYRSSPSTSSYTTQQYRSSSSSSSNNNNNYSSHQSHDSPYATLKVHFYSDSINIKCSKFIEYQELLELIKSTFSLDPQANLSMTLVENDRSQIALSENNIRLALSFNSQTLQIYVKEETHYASYPKPSNFEPKH